MYALTLGGPQRAVDKTSRKIAQLAQLVKSPPASFEDVEAFLFEHGGVKLPVLDAKHYSLVELMRCSWRKLSPHLCLGQRHWQRS